MSYRDLECEAGNLMRDIEFLEEARRRKSIPNPRLERTLAEKQEVLKQLEERTDDLIEEDEE